MKKLSDLFEVRHGSKLDLNKMHPSPANGGINFIGRSSQKQGITATVAPIEGLAPFPEGLITVALGSARPLSAFVQDRQFYTGQNVAVLTPIGEMTFSEKVYMCLCIRHNRFRYSVVGREANRTIRELILPDAFPPWINSAVTSFGNVGDPATPVGPKLAPASWQPFKLGELFEIRKGKRLVHRDWKHGHTPFVGTSTKRNGIVGYVDSVPMFQGGSITVPYNGQGGVGWACYQPDPFCASDDIQVLLSPPDVDQAAMMFVSVVLRRERYRYSFGRKWHLERMRETTIRLPARNKNPDWASMSKFMQALPFAVGALGALSSGSTRVIPDS